jgi:TldD protein
MARARTTASPSLPHLATPPPAPLLPQPLIERLLGAAMSRGGEFAEVYVERAVTTAVVLDEKRIKSAQTGLVQGVGVRVIAGAKVGYAYSDDLEEAALLRAASTAALIAHAQGSERSFRVSRTPAPSCPRA